MSTVNITHARAHLYELAKSVIISHEPVTVTSKEGEFIILSKEDYEALQETLYLYTNKGLVDDIAALKDRPDSDFGSRDDLPW